MEEQTEETFSEGTISDDEFDPNQFVDEGIDEWDSVSQFSEVSEASISSDFSGSSVWLYFDKNPDHAPDHNVCKNCSKKYKPSTSVTTLRKHLQEHQLQAPTRSERKGEKRDNPLSKKEQKKYDNYLVKWLIQDLQPFTVVDNPSFRAFINALFSRYVIPDRHKAKGINRSFFLINIITNFLLFK